eukprot:TRINITY_DN12216_c0_g1_i2.p1 TRINITY_DN12216_c0_g1~~TRINITY_DN12216_c0_g1_i2.p1  ORF type:complete len:536 (-),score=73.37 TRINITY_DN12216_c0_g1_i2:361-1968(-)
MGMSGPGEIARLAEIAQPSVRVLVNVGPCHLEGVGGTLEGVARAKAELVQTALRPADVCVVNGDDALLVGEMNKLPSDTKIVFFGRGAACDVRVLQAEQLWNLEEPQEDEGSSDARLGGEEGERPAVEKENEYSLRVALCARRQGICTSRITHQDLEREALHGSVREFDGETAVAAFFCESSDCVCRSTEDIRDGLADCCKKDEDRVVVDVPHVLGCHLASNIAGAAAVALALGVPLSVAARDMAHFRPLGMRLRLERVFVRDGEPGDNTRAGKEGEKGFVERGGGGATMEVVRDRSNSLFEQQAQLGVQGTAPNSSCRGGSLTRVIQKSEDELFAKPSSWAECESDCAFSSSQMSTPLSDGHSDSLGRPAANIGKHHPSKTPSTAFLLNDCYNSNPTSLYAALRVLADFPLKRRASSGQGMRWALLGDMLELGDSAVHHHLEVLEKFAQLPGIHVLGLAGPLFQEAARQWAVGSRGNISLVLALDACQLAEKVCGEVRGGDVVLLKGSRGMHMERLLHKLQAPQMDGGAHDEAP